MTKNGKIASIGGGILLLIVLVYFFGTQKNKSYVTDNWIETYNPNDKGPYGTYVIKELLDTLGLFENFIEINKKIENNLIDHEGVNDIYFFIGKENFMSESSVETLMNFVADGNTAFIASESMSSYLNEYFFLDIYDIYKTKYDSIQKFQFYNTNLEGELYECKFINHNKGKSVSWKYFKETNFEYWGEDGSGVEFIGTNKRQLSNLVKIQFGEGTVYLYTTPYAFTNVNMLKTQGFEYIENVLKHIPPGKIQWDKYNLNQHYDYSEDNNNNENKRSILEFLFKHKSLTWAFVIFVITVLLYAFFKGKRKQDIVKSAELKSNTTLRYIETISALYLQEQKHVKLIKLKENNFLNYIHEHYFLTTTKVDELFIERLAEKSQIKKSNIEYIFNNFKAVKFKTNVSDQVLIELHQHIEYFYKNCK